MVDADQTEGVAEPAPRKATDNGASLMPTRTSELSPNLVRRSGSGAAEMAGQVIAWGRLWLASADAAVARTLLIVLAYIAIYLALERVSFFYTLPGTGLPLWNLAPALSLALLVRKGLGFTPVVFLTSVIANEFVVAFPQSATAAIVMGAVSTAGYAVIAAGLRRLAHAGLGLRQVADTVWLIVINAVGTAATAAAVVAALATIGRIRSDLFGDMVLPVFIADFAGILALLPVALTFRDAGRQWKELPTLTKALDLCVFALSLSFALWMAFGVARSIELQYFYLLLLPVLWIGARRGLAWAALAILFEKLALVFVSASLIEASTHLLSYQAVSCAIAATGLILGAVVTDRERAKLYLRQHQAEIYRTSRLSTADALGAAVVHEISQPLATIATYAHVYRRLRDSGSTDPVLLDDTIAKLEAEVRRAIEIIERFRDFVGKDEQRWSLMDLGEVVRRVVVALEDLTGSHGVIVRIDALPVPPIAADRVQMEQVLVNLLRNAIEAVADNNRSAGMVVFRLRQFDDKVQLEVEDNGPGVPPEMAGRLFQPFETSKQRGMGLGLSISREVVKAHGGSLWWDPTFKTGARFVLELPYDRIA